MKRLTASGYSITRFFHLPKSFSLFIAFFLVSVTHANALNYEVAVKLLNYKSDMIILGYYKGEKSYIKDTAMLKNGMAVFKGEEKLEKGMYLLVEPGKNIFVQFLIDDDIQQLSLELDFAKPADMKVTGSQATAQFLTYLKFLELKRPQMEDLKKQLNEASEAEKKKTINAQIEELDREVNKYQKEFIQKNPNSLASLIVKINLQYEPPAFNGTEKEKQEKEYYWYKKHWFDNASITDTRMHRTPLLIDKINYYIDKLTVQHPDSIIVSVDEVLRRVEKTPETYKFLLIELINRYAASNIVGMDAVYVHIALKYYAQGKAPWIDFEQLKEIIEKAHRLEPLLIGKKAPDFEVYELKKEKTRLWDFDATYTILFFWSNNCSYCQKYVASLVEVEKQFRDKGVKVFTVCTDVGDKFYIERDVINFVNNNSMESFLNTTDAPWSKSKFLFNVSSTPQIFILDKNKVIKSKSIAGDQVKEVLENLFKN